MVKGKYKITLFFVSICFFLLINGVTAQRTASASGSWTNTATWGGSSVPTSADAVTINSGITVTIDAPGAQCASITFNTAGATNGLTMNSGTSLNVIGNITTTRPSVGFNTLIDVGAASLVVGGNIALTGTSGSAAGTRLTKVTLSTGTVSVTGNITSAGIESQVIFSGAGIVNVAGSFLSSASSGSLTASTGTVNYNGAAQSVTAFIYNHLNLSGSGAKTVNAITVNGNLNLSGTANATTAGVITVNGNLNLASSSTLSIAGFNTTISGTTTIDGRLSNTSTTGNKSFLGPVFVKNGGVFTETVAEQIDFGSDVTIENGGTITENGAAVMTYMGNFQNDGTYTASTGIHRFGGASKTIGGANSVLMPTITFTAAYTNSGTLTSATLLTVTGTTLTNNGTVTATTDLAGSGTFLQGSGSLLNITANSNITTLEAAVASNTVNYNKAGDQFMHTGNYYVLEVSGSGTKTPSSDMTIGGLCTITSGTMDLGSGNLVSLNGGIGGTSGILTGSSVSELAIGANITLPSSLISLKFFYLNAGTTVLSNSLSIAAATGSLVLNGGMVSTSSFITVNNTAATSVSGGSTTSYINGPLKRSLALGSNVGSWDYPVGAGGRYLPFTLINPVCVTAAQTYSVEAFSANCGGSNGSCAAGISATEYWKGTLFSGSGSISSASVSLGRNTALGTLDAIGRATTSSASGIYNSYKGTVSGTNINVSENVGALSFGSPAYFAMIVQGTDTPTLTTPTSTVLTLNTAVLGGSITSVGCSNITTRGVYYSTTNGFANGTGTCFSVTAGPYTTGSFTISVTGLLPSTTYYYVAFATNSNGTSYSPQGTFTVRTPVNYYVNNTYSASTDIYTTASGTNTGTNGAAKSTPAASLTWLLGSSTYSASFNYGDTIFVDAGAYSDNTLSSPNGGVVIQGAGIGKTVFTNPSGTNYFMYINDNYTVLKGISLTKYNKDVGSAGQTYGIAANTIGVQIIDVQNYYGSASNYGGGYPIEVLSGASVLFSGGGSTCDSGGGLGNAGGGIHISGAATTVTITNFLFVGGQASLLDGIALKIDGGNVNVKNSLFKDNTAFGAMQGVAIAVTGGTVNVYDSYITDNKTNNNSGGTEVGGSIYITGGNFNITRSIIQNHTQLNASSHSGAGIGNSGGNVVVDSCYFTNNDGKTTTATDLYSAGGTMLARYCTFGSANQKINRAGGTFSVSNSGVPTGSTSVTMINSTVSSYTPNPSVPGYTGTCSSAITSFTILPIELTRFEGDCNNGNVILNWQTATEKNNQQFNIQRSSDGLMFETIGSVAGAGNSEQLRNYAFVDEDDIDGLSYYRLSQTDYDGKESQSQIIAVDHVCGEKQKIELEVYPNPTRDNFMVDVKLFKKADVSFEIVNSLGQLVKKIDNRKYDIGIQSIDINVTDLSTGIYYLNVLVDSKPYVKKLIKL